MSDLGSSINASCLPLIVEAVLNSRRRSPLHPFTVIVTGAVVERGIFRADLFLAIRMLQEQGGPVPPPPLTEQEADATTLMTIDDLNALEKEAMEARREESPKPGMDTLEEEVCGFLAVLSLV